MIKVNVVLNNIFWKRYIKNPQNFFKKKIKLLNKKSKSYKKKTLIFSLLLSGTKDIIKLNKKFRNKNKSTDVLSFPFQTKRELNNKLKKEKEIYLGDIIINLNKIKSKKISKNFKNEFDRLWIHGLVHLLGHNHKKNKEFLRMIKIEKKYFDFINV